MNRFTQPALEHAGRGHKVFPCHNVKPDGACSCQEGKRCKSPGKHPRFNKDDLPHGCHSATDDEQQIRTWGERWPLANVGIACGAPSGIDVLDVDPRHGGDETLAELERQYGELPHTVEAVTGGGGRHLLFHHVPGREFPNEVGFAPGLDTRSTGGLIVAPGSVHANGNVYAWEVNHHPDDTELAEAPDWLVEAVQRKAAEGAKASADPIGAKIPHGTQHTTLFRIGCSMRRRGLTAGAIEAALWYTNEKQCEKPGTRQEIRKIAESAAKYAPSDPILGRMAAGQEDPPADRGDEDAPPERKAGGKVEAENLTSHLREGPCEVRFVEHEFRDLEPLDEDTELPSLSFLGEPGYIIIGWSHIISAPPKCGKTDATFQCVCDWLAEGVSVLWISEEGENIWRLRRGRLTEAPAGLRLVLGLGVPPRALLKRAREGKEQVVILDTVRNLLQIEDENDNSAVVAALGPWEAALQGRTRLYLHHERKSGGDHGQAIAGAGAFLGMVDRAVEIGYDAHVKTRRRVVVHSRVTGAPDLLYELQDGTLRALGDPAALDMERVKAAVRKLLASELQTTKEIREQLPAPRPALRTVQSALAALLEAGQTERDPAEEKKGATYRWRAVENLTSHDPSSKCEVRSEPAAARPNGSGGQEPHLFPDVESQRWGGAH